MMMTRRIIEIVLFALALGFAWISAASWLASRNAQRQFTAEIAAQQKLIAEADVTKHQQENDLKKLLKSIADLKEKTRTPSEVINELPKYLPLPSPITIAAPRQTGCVQQAPRQVIMTHTPTIGGETAKTLPDSRISAAEPLAVKAPTPSSLSAHNLDAQLPLQDLKPLFDFVQDCRTCAAELDAARKTAASDSVKISALTRERDQALRSEKSSFWHRLQQDAVLLAFGAMAGYAAVH
jgi:hypothetical protein